MSNQLQFFLPYDRSQELLSTLSQFGYHCVGPQVKDGAIVYDTLHHTDQLPWGIKDEQSPGYYRIHESHEKKAFGWVNGPQAIKPFLFQSNEILWKAEKDEEGHVQFHPVEDKQGKVALIGVRPCDIAAMLIQDKVFLESEYIDKRYQKRRQNLFIIAANCTRASNNCFCISAGGSTRATNHFDLAMTEIKNGFVIESGSDRGEDVLASLKLELAEVEQIESANEDIQAAADMQTKTLPDVDLNKVLFENLEHPQWKNIGERCLSCTNCTQVCPTCFCHSETDIPTLDGSQSHHIRQWDSCFTEGHSYIHGMVIRENTELRYRQWLTHKLGSWHDQFGTSGCVGCGRCITWCPVGIDITVETHAICQSKKGKE